MRLLSLALLWQILEAQGYQISSASGARSLSQDRTVYRELADTEPVGLRVPKSANIQASAS